MRAKRDNYQEISNRFIAALEAGTVPWHQPWVTLRPMSMSSGEPYHGTNRLILSLVAAGENYSSAWWGTYDQIARLAGMVKNPETNRWESPDGTPRGVRKGEHGEYITRWITWTKRKGDDDDEDPQTGRTLKIFKVFNAEQAEQLPAQYYQAAAEFAEIADAELLLKGYWTREDAPKVFHDTFTSAHYTTDGSDEIHLPPRGQFTSPEGYYSTAFHESAHSTGWRTRLGREGIVNFDHFGTGQYALEELTAEIAAALLDAEAGIDGMFDQSAAYVANWLQALKNDKKLIITAAAAAQRAVDYITGEGDGNE